MLSMLQQLILLIAYSLSVGDYFFLLVALDKIISSYIFSCEMGFNYILHHIPSP